MELLRRLVEEEKGPVIQLPGRKGRTEVTQIFKSMLLEENVPGFVVLVAESGLTLCDPWTAARQAPLSMGFPRQEYWSGLPLPSPGHLPDPGIEPGSPALQVGSLPSEPPGKPCLVGLGQRSLFRQMREAFPMMAPHEGGKKAGSDGLVGLG